jgi:hypothetical protein
MNTTLTLFFSFHHQIDFNQELCDPVEKSFMVSWQSTMDSTIKTLLASCERDLNSLAKTANAAVVAGLRRKGVEQARLHAMGQASSRGASTTIRDGFANIRKSAADQQRDINRTLLPHIQGKMQGGYNAAMYTERGPGRFNRIKK